MVGRSTLWVYDSANDFTEHSEDFRWTEETGSISLGSLPGVDTSAVVGSVTDVAGMNADGSVLVGMTAGAGGSRVAYRWTSATGMVELPAPSPMAQVSLLGVSADGSVIVGTAITNGMPHAFRWTADTGMALLEPAPGDTNNEAGWMSADGAVVAGTSSHGAVQQPFRWTAESGVVALGLLPTTTSCGLAAMPANLDGNTLVGSCGSSAFRWTASSGMVSLGSLPGYDQLFPSGVSADGTTISGQARNAADEFQVFHWNSRTGLTGLGFLPGDVGTTIRPLNGTSRDGSVVVGSSSSASGESVAFRWTEASGMQRLAPLPGENQSDLLSVTDDGSLSAGNSMQHEPGKDRTAGPDAVVWRAAGPPISVAAALEAAGVDIAGAQLISGFLLSDGSALLGTGTNASGGIRGFVAHVPL